MNNRRAAVAALLRLLDTLSGPATVTIQPLGGGAHTLYLEPAPASPTIGDLADARADILRVLREVGHRLSTSKLLTELERRQLIHGESTVKGRLAQMVRDGELTSDRNVRPPGYGLPEWGENGFAPARR